MGASQSRPSPSYPVFLVFLRNCWHNKAMNNHHCGKGSILLSVVILVLTVLIGGGLYFYLWGQIPTTLKITEKLTKEDIVQSKDTTFPSEEKQSPTTLFDKDIRSIPIADQDSIFMLGDTNSEGNVDWRTILTISTIAKISPVLIITNDKSVDDFSPKLFIEQYSPSKIYLHNYNYNFPKTERIDTKNINSQLYKSSNFVVISNGNDYDTSLIATSFAAYFNIPIFFSPLTNEDKDLIEKWSAEKIGIGVKEDVTRSLSINEAVNILKKNSDYLILTASDDLNKPQRARFSLAAPILAGGRNGVVLNIKNPTRASVKSRVNEITQDGFAPKYLVVVGSEKNFPFLEYDIVPPGTFYGQVDDHKYFVNLYYWADYNPSSEYIPDAAVGAITGYSISDISSLIARSIFYDKISKSNKFVYWSPYSSGDPAAREYASKIDSILDTDLSRRYINDFKSYNSLFDKNRVITEINNSSVFVYNGHSWKNLLGNMSTEEIPVFRNPTFIFAFGCGMLKPWNPGTIEDKQNKPMIGYEAIRKGAVGMMGAAEVWFVSGEGYYGLDQRMTVENALNLPLGDSNFLTQRMFDAYYLYNNEIPGGEKDYYTKRYVYLLGDPALKVKTSSQMQPNIFSEKIRMNFTSAIQEKMLCYKEAGCILCKSDEKECTIMEKEPTKVVQFTFPLLLDSFIYSTAINFSLGETYYFGTSLRFFTPEPIRDVNIVNDVGEQISLASDYKKNLGKHCFSFGNKKYCPNLIRQLNFGSVNTATNDKLVPKYLDVLFVK